MPAADNRQNFILQVQSLQRLQRDPQAIRGGRVEDDEDLHPRGDFLIGSDIE